MGKVYFIFLHEAKEDLVESLEGLFLKGQNCDIFSSAVRSGSGDFQMPTRGGGGEGPISEMLE